MSSRCCMCNEIYSTSYEFKKDIYIINIPNDNKNFCHRMCPECL